MHPPDEDGTLTDPNNIAPVADTISGLDGGSNTGKINEYKSHIVFGDMFPGRFNLRFKTILTWFRRVLTLGPSLKPPPPPLL